MGISRRSFLALVGGGLALSTARPLLSASPWVLRPPGALASSAFLAACLRCGKCAQVCRYGSIRIASGADGTLVGTPFIRPRETPCFLCMDCVPACPTGALRPGTAREKAAMGIAVVDRDTCLAWQGNVCHTCFMACPFYDKAIVLEDFSRPVVREEHCVGCGICEHVCPMRTAAIRVRQE